jgi:DNA invertase Pin-like site-specific DNA recombinase
MLVGYARVSTDDQNLDLQKDALKKAGCQKIYVDCQQSERSGSPEILLNNRRT